MTSNSLLKRWQKRDAQQVGPVIPPVIIAGMHRSGTTLVTTLLEQAGLFIGMEKESNSESTYFIRLNQWLLAQAGCRWDEPERWNERTQDPTLRRLLVEQMRHMMQARPSMEFLGRAAFKRGNTLLAMTEPWGWKDPRNSITLPIWLAVFPDAKVVWVERHGCDVAASLRERSQEEIKKWPSGVNELEGTLLTDSARCLDFHGAFSLWYHYQQAGRAQVAALGERALLIRYESLLLHPQPVLRQLLIFCGLSVTESALEAGATWIKPDRAFAHRQHAGGYALTLAEQAMLAEFGYD